LHQAQGVEICPVHKTFLENSSIRARDHVLSAEFVSAERAVGSVAPRLALSSPYFSILQDICTAIQFLLEHPDLALSREVSLSERYRILLAHQGWVTVNGHVRRTDFVNEFKNTYSPVLLSLLRCEITQPEYLKKTWPYRITRSSQEAQHPLHHILFLRFLGLTVEQFFSQDLKPYQPFGEGPWPCLNPVCTYYQQKHISTSQIHEQNGKGLIVGQFSCECGFTYCRSGPDRMDEDVHRRSKILSYGAAWETKLRELWFNPTVTLREAAHLLGISLSAVQRQAKRLQLPTPRIALRAARPVRHPQRIRTKKDIAWYRTQWLTLVQENSDASKRALCRKAPGIYDWLDRQDHEWFIAHCPPAQKKRQLKKPPVNALRLSGDALRKEKSKDHDRQLADAIKEGGT
jgi:hypothetical protein